MKYFMEQQEQIWPELIGKKIYLLLDYDGTLTSIAQKPATAILSSNTRLVLRKLSKQPRCVLAIISGRSLTDLKKMVHIPKIIYAGNHGYEIDYYGRHLVFLKNKKFNGLLRDLEQCLREKTKGIKGVLIENKGISLSVHYRLAAKSKIHLVSEIFTEMVHPYVRRKLLSVSTGKMVLEVRPPIQWGKGDLVRWLLTDISYKKKNSAVFYFGDDTTDEDAFKVLRSKGYTVLVGKKKMSAAEYYLRNSGEVREILRKIWHNLGDKK